MIALDFNIPPNLRLTSNGSHGHWAPRRQVIKTLRALGAAKFAQLQPRPRMTRALLTVIIRYPNRMHRDAHNLMPTIKPLIDGIVTGPDPKRFKWIGLLSDDDNAHLTGPDLRPSDELCPKPWACQLRFEFEPIGDAS